MTTTTSEHPPQPLPDPDSRGYWESLAAGTLSLQRCGDCGLRQFPPLEACRHCGGALGFEALSGSGTIHTFIVQHHKVAPGFDADRPYVIALVTPEEAPEVRIPGRVVGASPDEVSIGARVRVDVVVPEGGSQRIPVFRLR